MTIKEIEALSGMSRANIRYYETEGFLSPERRENGYRDYSEADVIWLKKIKLLRKLGVPLEEIRRMQREFGWKGRYGHMLANRTLHRNARRISQADDNFRCVLQSRTSDEALEWIRAYEA